MKRSNLLILKVHSINGYVDGSIHCLAQFLQDSARNITIKENPKFQVLRIRDQTNTLHSHQLHVTPLLLSMVVGQYLAWDQGLIHA